MPLRRRRVSSEELLKLLRLSTRGRAFRLQDGGGLSALEIITERKRESQNENLRYMLEGQEIIENDTYNNKIKLNSKGLFISVRHDKFLDQP